MSSTVDSRSVLARAGGAAWIAGTVQSLLVQLIVGLAWPGGYSWSARNISDLGNVRCDPRQVCSPWHAAMNVSFVAEAVLLAAGAVLLGYACLRTVPGRLAVAGLLVAAAGLVLVGANPSDVAAPAHVLGALLHFVAGNVALVLFGAVRGVPRPLRVSAVLLGVAGLIASLLFVHRVDLGLGLGGMERVAVYGLDLWTLAAGGWALLRARWCAAASPRRR